jgi:hypothetical protein
MILDLSPGFKTFHIQDIARLLNVGEALFDPALIVIHLAV